MEGLLTCLPLEKHQPVRTLSSRENSVSAYPTQKHEACSMRINTHILLALTATPTLAPLRCKSS